jgi:oleate hydratase
VTRAYIVGGGIAGLATAALLIRDGGMRGDRIVVFEQADELGGSLDGAGDPKSGYVIRGGRMFEPHFACTYDLFAAIPSLTDPSVSVTDEIHEFTRRTVGSSRSRLVSNGQRIEAPPLELSLRDKLDLGRLSLTPERLLDGVKIDEYFSAAFFETNFWFMWCTMFAFQSWHSIAEFRRYMRRFMHLMPGFNRLEGIYRTPYNQYDSLILPLTRWLESRGVTFRKNTAVSDLDLDASASSAVAIELSSGAQRQRLDLDKRDVLFVTLGSMTEDSALGTMDAPATINADAEAGAWTLWRRLARKIPSLGPPDPFCGDVAKSSWESFTVTLSDPLFFEFMERFTGNEAGSAGLVTFRDSSWLMSVVLAYQPHFLSQPEDCWVFWGYALHPEKTGDRVRKPMTACSGCEILEELFEHLPIGEDEDRVLATANCIPCGLPYITSQFMPRRAGDRPAVICEDIENVAFIGQYCEVPDDTVFTVEYSIRTAQTAVYALLGIDKPVTPMYRGYRDPRVVARALRAMA